MMSPESDDRDENGGEFWPPHTGEGPDVSNLGNEAESEDDPDGNRPCR